MYAWIVKRGSERKDNMRYMQQPRPGTTVVPGVPDSVLVEQALKEGEQSAEVLQQVLLQLYLSLPRLNLKKYTRMSGWLFRVAYNRCIDEVRKRYRRNEVCFSALERESTEEEPSPVEQIADSQPLPDEVAVQRDLHDTLRQAID